MLPERPRQSELARWQVDIMSFLPDLRKFLAQEGLEYLSKPVDHVALKAGDRRVFERTLEELVRYAQRITVTRMRNPQTNKVERRIANVTLLKPLWCGGLRVNGVGELCGLGETKSLEVIESRPSQTTGDTLTFDHVESFADNFEEAVLAGGARGIVVSDNGYHRTVCFKFGRWEYKLSDHPLTAVIDQQLQTGGAKIYYQRAA